MRSRSSPGEDSPKEGPGSTETRRSGRRPGFSGTRQDIIQAARKIFAQRGYGGGTMRAIAREANVDAALIHHFFMSKEGLFFAAIGDAAQADEVLEGVLEAGATGSTGRQLILAFIKLWQDPQTRDPMLAVVRSAVSSDDAARLAGELVTTEVVGRVVKTVASSHKELRTTLIGSVVIGLIMMRYVLRMEPLASLDPDPVATLFGPVIDNYLTGDLDVAEEVGGLGGYPDLP